MAGLTYEIRDCVTNHPITAILGTGRIEVDREYHTDEMFRWKTMVFKIMSVEHVPGHASILYVKKISG